MSDGHDYHLCGALPGGRGRDRACGGLEYDLEVISLPYLHTVAKLCYNISTNKGKAPKEGRETKMTTQADFDLNNFETNRAEALNRCDFNYDGTLANLPSDLSSGYYEIAARELGLYYRGLYTNQPGYVISDEEAEELADLAWNLAAEDAKQEIQEKYGI